MSNHDLPCPKLSFRSAGKDRPTQAVMDQELFERSVTNCLMESAVILVLRVRMLLCSPSQWNNQLLFHVWVSTALTSTLSAGISTAPEISQAVTMILM